MAKAIGKEDILKAARAMSKEERLNLIAAIAALPESVVESPEAQTSDSTSISDHDVMKLTKQFSDHHKTLLRRLAE
jgi:hypothetical protein